MNAFVVVSTDHGSSDKTVRVECIFQSLTEAELYIERIKPLNLYKYAEFNIHASTVVFAENVA